MKSMWIYMFVMCIVLCSGLSVIKENKQTRVCIIGAGIAGLTSARHLQDEGISFSVFEATKYVGGTWRYDPRVGSDENGQPLHTSMYKHLRTNLPKPTMELRDYPLPKDLPSFPTWKSYYCYLKSYAQHFDLFKHIKFLMNIISVKRVGNKWKVKHKHVVSGEESEEDFDFVIVGTGHHSKPNYPTLPGAHLFTGSIIHSHDYREPEPYKGRRVMVMGAGPSGMDIGLDLALVTKTLVHSHHSKVNFVMKYPKSYIRKPDVKELNATGAIFVDGTYEDLDDIVYCTGYQYYYPFLDQSSELQFNPTHVTPLYKYMVNINQPTMVFMGLVVRACLVVAIEAQARYATALIKGNFTLPPKQQLLEEHQKWVNTIKSAGKPLSALHLLAEKEDQYYADLSKESGIERVPPVMFKIRIQDMVAKIENWYTYRQYAYNVIDDINFEKVPEDDFLKVKERNNTCAIVD